MSFLKTFKLHLPNNLNPMTGITLYFLLFLSLASYYLINWPIIALDNDLWYHLNSGRYIFNNHALPHTSYFSFIDPPREFVDYYWLFQAAVYLIYSLFDYYGLIQFRTFLYLATITIIFIYLIKNREERNSLLSLIIIFALYSFFLLTRFELIRPHDFSYLFIVLFLYILEFHPQKVFLLPIIAIFWCNLHGIEYPVILLITIGYLLEFFYIHIRQKTHLNPKDLLYVIPLVITLGSPYITPHGSKLITVSTSSIAHASQYIREFKPLSLDELFSFQFTKIPRMTTTLFNIIFFVVIFSVGMTLWNRRKIRISHLFIFLGGVILLFKGLRFTYEFVFLALPLINIRPLSQSFYLQAKKTKWLMIPLVSLILLFPLYGLKNYFGNPPKYPFSTLNLPQGVVTFLNYIPAKGKIFNHPNKGGYLQWMLYPKYKIFSDMEVPFLFKDEDSFLSTNARNDEYVLKKFLIKYDPSFIMVPNDNKNFPKIIEKFPDFTLVFFDYSDVLYLNRKHYPELAVQYDLGDLNPFELVDNSIDSLKNKDLVKQKLLKMREIFPDCSLTNQILATIFNKEGNYSGTLTFADSIIKNFPEDPNGYLLKGDALRGLKHYDESILVYKTAIKKSDEPSKFKVYKPLGLAYIETHQYGKAYYFLKKGIDIFYPETTYKELFDLSSMAMLSGKTDEAAKLMIYAYIKVPLGEAEWKKRIEKQLKDWDVNLKDYAI